MTKVDVFGALFVLGNRSALGTDRIPGTTAFPIACWQLRSRDGMRHFGQFSLGCHFGRGLHGSSVPGLTPLSFGLPIATALRNPFLLLIFTCGAGGIYGGYPEMETLGVEKADF